MSQTTPVVRGPYEKTRGRRALVGRVAYELVAESGHRQLTIAGVIRRSGLTESQVMRLVPSREHLLVAALEHEEHEARPSDMTSTEHGTASGPEAMIAAAAEEGVRQPHVVRLFVTMFAEASDPAHPAHAWAARHRRASAERFAAVLVGLQDSGWADPGVDPHRFGRQFQSLWDGLRGIWLYDPSIDLGGEVASGLRLLARRDLVLAREAVAAALRATS